MCLELLGFFCSFFCFVYLVSISLSTGSFKLLICAFHVSVKMLNISPVVSTESFLKYTAVCIDGDLLLCFVGKCKDGLYTKTLEMLFDWNVLLSIYIFSINHKSKVCGFQIWNAMLSKCILSCFPAGRGSDKGRLPASCHQVPVT